MAQQRLLKFLLSLKCPLLGHLLGPVVSKPQQNCITSPLLKMTAWVLSLRHQSTQAQRGAPQKGKRIDIAKRDRVFQGPDYMT